MSDDVRQILADLGEEYTVAHAEEVMARDESFRAKLPEGGATVTNLPEAEIEAWATGLPNLAGSWVEDNAEEVLRVYMEKIKAAGFKLCIDRPNR